MSDKILTHCEDGILEIRFNRPHKKNALTLDMYGALADTFQQAEEDSEIRVILITGSEGCFCAGNDLSAFMDPSGDTFGIVRFLQAISTATKPVIAAVDGVAIGIGTTMLLHCDLIYAAQGARFKLPFVDLGLVPEAASSVILPAMLGHQGASALLLLGEMFNADRAREIGLVNSVFAPENLQEEARKIALHLASRAPAAVRETKALLKRAQKELIASTIGHELEVLQGRLSSPEVGEALQAFMEKRQPDFSKFS